jgi:D-psicose/D-tagatose/L-ribulose 3-epimerase
MQFGASTFIWVSPFSGSTLDLIDKVGDLGFEIIEICVEDPGTIDPAAIRPRLERRGLKATVCGAFGPDRDISSDDPAVREAGVAYIRRCIDIAADLDAPSVIGPMADSNSVANTTSAQEAGEVDAAATTEADDGRPGCDRCAAQGRLGRAGDRSGAWSVAQRDQRGVRARPRY